MDCTLDRRFVDGEGGWGGVASPQKRSYPRVTCCTLCVLFPCVTRGREPLCVCVCVCGASAIKTTMVVITFPHVI